MEKMKMKVHPFAAKFPLITGKRFDELVESIRKHGLQDPVVRKDGLILDGRNRIAACEKAGVDVRYKEYGGKLLLVDYIGIHNMDRRDLTKDQRSMLAVNWYEAAERETGAKRKAEGRRKGGAKMRQKANEKAIAGKPVKAYSDDDETGDDFMEEEEEAVSGGAKAGGKKAKKKSARLPERIAKLGGADVTRHSVEQAQKIKKHSKGKRLEKEVLSGEKTMAAAVKETKPQGAKKTKGITSLPWNGKALTKKVVRIIKAEIQTKSPSEKARNKFFDEQLTKGLTDLEQEFSDV